MKTAFSIAVLAVLLVAPGRCFALWSIDPVSTERAKQLGMEVRSTAAGPNQVRVELEFKIEGRFEEFSPEGKFKDRSGVELRIGEENNQRLFDSHALVTVRLREDRSKPGRVAVSFTADRTQLDKINLWVMAPESDGGTAYVLRVKDFVEPEKGR
jgi:hypothetical protein